jgi:hypothetical protein
MDGAGRPGQPAIAVPGQSLAGWLLIGADSGKYREQLSTQWKDGTEAAAALQRGEVAAAAGMASELESALAGDARFAIEPLPCRVRATAGPWAWPTSAAPAAALRGAPGSKKRPLASLTMTLPA